MEDKKEVINSDVLSVEENVLETPIFESIAVEDGINNAIDEAVEEGQELTDDEKRELLINGLKELNSSKSNFKPIIQKGNKTINNYGTTYKKKRQKKNKLQKKSRKINRG